MLTPRLIALLTLCSLPAMAQTGTSAAEPAPPARAEPGPPPASARPAPPPTAEPAPPPAEPAPRPAEPAPPSVELTPPFAKPTPPGLSQPSPALAEPVPRTDIPDDYWDPPVITPTGQPSRVSESPSTTFVITGDEVRHAGATTIPEILRRVPGMDVRLLGATDGQIGPRGLAFEVADRILVMIDGRTAYVDFFGGTAYEMLPVSPLDIDRIEVVLGPGASVYGQKAMLGTLNIITRSAAEFPGFEARVDAGRPGDVRAAAREGIVAGNWRVRFTGLFRRLTPYPIDNTLLAQNTALGLTATETVYPAPVSAGGGTASIGYAPRPGVELALEAGAMTGNTVLLPTGAQVYPFWSTLAYAKADGRVAMGGPGSPYGDLRLKAVCNFGWIRGTDFPSPMNQLAASYQTPYAEVTHEFRYRAGGIGMQARWGAEGRLNLLQDRVMTTDVSPVWNVAGFASNEALLGRWRVTTGLRVDRQSLTDNTLSPRVSLVFSPAPSQQLRVAFNSGYNNPSLVQNFAHFQIGGGGPYLTGDRALKPEQIYYGEFAYGGTATRWLRLFADAFAYRIINSIELNGTFTGSLAPPPTPSTFDNLSWGNQAPLNAYGGEAGFEIAPKRGLSGYAHYAYIRIAGDPSNPYVAAGAYNVGSPQHKVTAGALLDLPRRAYVTADGQYFGAATVARVSPILQPDPMQANTFLTFVSTTTSPLVIVNARVGMAFDSGLDVSIAGTDLLNQTQAQLLGAQNPRLRVMATIAYTP